MLWNSIFSIELEYLLEICYPEMKVSGAKVKYFNYIEYTANSPCNKLNKFRI